MQEELKSLRERLKSVEKYLRLDELAGKKTELVNKTTAPDFWSNPTQARQITRDLAAIIDSLELYEKLDKQLSDLEVLFLLTVEAQAKDKNKAQAELLELKESTKQLASDLDDLEVRSLLSGKYDEKDALCRIQSGAGGSDAQDWARMVLEMYECWAKNLKYKWELVSYQATEGGGIASAEFTIRGSYTYGYLQSEHGVHRLVRISPFSKEGKRETSFASMNVVPLIEDLEKSVEIDDKDLRIDTYRSSGAGGQHVNVTDSAVRITHLPTGLVASCQAERSQLQNKEKAMEILIARLLDLQHQESMKAMAEITGNQATVDFGSQIRSYVLHPYQMVKDERTGFETGKVDAVLGGELAPFMQSYLRWLCEK